MEFTALIACWGRIVWIDFLTVIAFRPVSALALALCFQYLWGKCFASEHMSISGILFLIFLTPLKSNYHVDLNHYPPGFRYVHMPLMPSSCFLLYPILLFSSSGSFLLLCLTLPDRAPSNRWSSITFLPMQQITPSSCLDSLHVLPLM